MLLTENEQKWSQIISEELNIKDQNKLAWMTKYAQIHESVQSNPGAGAGIYSTPLNTMGIGNPMAPMGVGYNATDGSGIGNTGADFHNPNYATGSGDIPMSTLSIALQIAATTIGFELVPVIPANGPWAMLTYFDTPYAGGKLGRFNETSMDGKGEGDDNKPIYIKFNLDDVAEYSEYFTPFVKGQYIAFETVNGLVYGEFLGLSRIDAGVIIRVLGTAAELTQYATPDTIVSSATLSIGDVFRGTVKAIYMATSKTTDFEEVEGIELDTTKRCRPELVSQAADHIQGFANFFDGNEEPMTRAQNETGVGNTIGARMFSKWIQMGAYEVTGSVTRQQLQDMPLYGIDVVGQILQQMQNDISQEINNRILDRLFKMGVENAVTQHKVQGVDLNLYFAASDDAPTKALANFSAAKKFQRIDGTDATTFGTNWMVKNATQNTAAENVTTHQRRIMSRVLAASNLIANVSRRGRGEYIVTNTQVLSALEDASTFVVAPMVNTLVQDGSQSLYCAGSVAGMNLYVDPYMMWDDTRVLVGRKGDGKTPGVVFMPYILCDTVQTIVEGTMAPKMLCNSRFAIVDAGWWPEQNYFAFMVCADEGVSII